MKLRLLAAAAIIGVLVAGHAPAQASSDSDVAYAPVDRPFPGYRTPVEVMDKAVTCSGDFRNGKEPVYLVPGTWFTYKTQFSWSWAPAMTRAGIPWCSVDAPHDSLGDLTVAAEYDIYVIRKMFALSGGRKIAVVGHSQGGVRPRAALRFAPDTRAMVEDFVGVAPGHQGATLFGVFTGVCGATIQVSPYLTYCPPVFWQGLPTSNTVKALNSYQETFPGIDYSDVYSRSDLVLQTFDTELHPAPGTVYRRVAIQDICPTRVADHLTNGSVDSVSWALLYDAVANPGPVDPARISRKVCDVPFLPGLDPVAALQGAAAAPLQILSAQARAPKVTGEPALPCYVYAAGC